MTQFHCNWCEKKIPTPPPSKQSRNSKHFCSKECHNQQLTLDAKDDVLSQQIRNFYQMNMSCRAIGKELGKPHTTISRYLQNMGLSTSRSEGCKKASDEKYPDISITSELMEIIEGNLLGDGCISLVQPDQRSGYYQHGSKHINHINWIRDLFEEQKFPMKKIHSKEAFSRIVIGKNRSNVANFLESFYIKSKCTPSLKVIREKWYTAEGKIIPHSLKLTPKKILHWYLGDGSRNKDRDRIELATNGFTEIDNKFLVTLLNELGIMAQVNSASSGKGFRIYVSRKENFRNFFSLIGPCPPELITDYGHKWPNA
jgi:transposase-like protein